MKPNSMSDPHCSKHFHSADWSFPNSKLGLWRCKSDRSLVPCRNIWQNNHSHLSGFSNLVSCRSKFSTWDPKQHWKLGFSSEWLKSLQKKNYKLRQNITLTFIHTQDTFYNIWWKKGSFWKVLLLLVENYDLQSNLWTTATLGTWKSRHLKEMPDKIDI